MATKNLFVYGIAADGNVLFLITRMAAESHPAFLRDYELARSPRGSPTIRPRKGQRVEGLLVLGVTETYADRLDGYFGPNYAKEEFHVNSMGSVVKAEAYVLRFRLRIPEGVIQPGLGPGDEER